MASWMARALCALVSFVALAESKKFWGFLDGLATEVEKDSDLTTVADLVDKGTGIKVQSCGKKRDLMTAESIVFHRDTMQVRIAGHLTRNVSGGLLRVKMHKGKDPKDASTGEWMKRTLAWSSVPHMYEEDLCKQFRKRHSAQRCPLRAGRHEFRLALDKLPPMVIAGAYKLRIAALDSRGEQVACALAKLEVPRGNKGELFRRVLAPPPVAAPRAGGRALEGSPSSNSSTQIGTEVDLLYGLPYGSGGGYGPECYGGETISLGNLSTPTECAAVALATAGCGSQILFSDTEPSWPCRCCKNGWHTGYSADGFIYKLYEIQDASLGRTCSDHGSCHPWEFCGFEGDCSSCRYCHSCNDGVDGTCGDCGDGFPMDEQGPCAESTPAPVASACPAAFAELMGDDVQSVSDVKYQSGCSSNENRLEVTWNYEKNDGTAWWGYAHWNCYCESGSAITQMMVPGFHIQVTPADSTQYHPCTTDADCSGCAPVCVSHEGGGQDCRSTEGPGCSTYGGDTSTVFTEALIHHCFPNVDATCEAPPGEGSQMSWACEDKTVATVPGDAVSTPGTCGGVVVPEEHHHDDEGDDDDDDVVPEEHHHDPSKCREHSPDDYDSDCCGYHYETWCADGYSKVHGEGSHEDCWPGQKGYRCYPYHIVPGETTIGGASHCAPTVLACLLWMAALVQ